MIIVAPQLVPPFEFAAVGIERDQRLCEQIVALAHVFLIIGTGVGNRHEQRAGVTVQSVGNPRRTAPVSRGSGRLPGIGTALPGLWYEIEAPGERAVADVEGNHLAADPP